jgi:hypothetical protein
MACWQERLRQEWPAARDRATREYLLTIYAKELAALTEREREKFLAELEDHCCTRDSSDV